MYIWEEMNQNIVLNNKYIGIINSSILLRYNIQIPNVQRIIDDIKVNEIILYQKTKLKNNGICNFLGTLNIHFCEESNNLYIIDGQHRFEAIKVLNETINIPILIEIVKVKNIDELKENYNILNKNTPLPDFPENIDKSIPESVALYFKTRYKDIWSIKSKCQRPNIYFNHFQEALGILSDKLEIKTALELQSIIEEYNLELRELCISELYPKDISETMLEKCKKNNFYLGLSKYESQDYIYEWVKEILKNKKGIIFKKETLPKKINIPTKIKNDSWNYYIGNKSEDLCICCRNTKITTFNFHAGHIISSYNGGKTTIKNIVPICCHCNYSMSKRNMLDFMTDHYPDNIYNFNLKIYKNTL